VKPFTLIEWFVDNDVGGGVEMGTCDSTVDIGRDDGVALPTLRE